MGYYDSRLRCEITIENYNEKLVGWEIFMRHTMGEYIRDLRFP